MENNELVQNEQCCHNHCCKTWHKHHVLRWLLGLVILVVTFLVGYQVGEFKGQYENDGFGKFHRSNYMYNRPGFGNTYGSGMMGRGTVFFNEGTLPSVEARPAQPMMYFEQTTTTSPKK